MADRIYLFDTTLRDGAQTTGVDFSVADKIAIAEALDEIGIDYVEGGWPGANPTDDTFFTEPPKLKGAKLVAFGMTRRPGRSAENDPGLAPLVNSKANALCLVGKAWDFHVDVALEIEHDENVAMIRDSIAFGHARKGEAMYDAEHFFDGYKANPQFALKCITAAYEAGARWIVLCDTNGGTMPDEVERIVREVSKHVPGDHLGIHAHNDTEQAVANSLAAVRGGARQVQGTINGLGERCGNANMMSLIPSLMIKMGFDTGISPVNLKKLTHLSRMLDERLNRAPNRHQAYVGESAFAHKGGLHVSAVAKDPKTYEHVEPECVGNRRHIVVSDQAGRSNLLARLDDLGIEMPGEDKIRLLLDSLKQQEFKGYAYDGAEASFELLARKAMGEVPVYFRLSRFRVMDDRRWSARGELVTESEATVTVKVKEEEVMRVAMGNGPVNALDVALRQALVECYPTLQHMHLVDYKVRIMPPRADGTGTDAVTRVVIESADAEGHRWSTVGVSANIIDASYVALRDAYTYMLYREGVR
ncbi:citramalate synthase [Aestuariispira insulae]|uniref:Citramalate synthase n=1 Tax=Aestuariispira insulae TaxID=1461337 RepID=A0A3D9HWY2_9PROT|nr:citramalate synthase [Aestuariispira insulae]RED53925.1 2-isopropylmalate synthase [Aestuariispira insulae]